MLKTVMEGATLIGVAVAVLAGSFYAVGTIAYLARFNALGFDAHQFPSVGLELQVTGLAMGMRPAIYFGAFIIIVAATIALMKLADAWVQKLDAWSARLPKKSRVAGGVAFAAGGILLLGILGFDWRMIALGAFLSPAFVLVPRLLAAAGGALVLFLLCELMILQVSRDAATAANDWRQKIKPATTVIEFNDGSTRPAPGVRVACSEHFCGFHDGKTATVISLEGVRSIQSRGPQEQPPHTSDK